ncbi:MAG: adenosylcobinamide-GDP ribazoletransferase [Acidobacteria bacterium]|nr:adenosylcobinamide-GDP ribazoletransferase [Acidobacteriota bacterium]
MRARLVQEWRLFWTAVTLLTRLPAPRAVGFEESWLPGSAAYFPLVGLVVGLLAAAVYAIAALLWPAAVAALAAMAAAAWLTGGLHEDGWADLCDAAAASRDRERMLEVMKDSRIGAVGALALIFLVAGKLAALTALPAAKAAAALIAAHTASRWSSLPLLWRLPYARPAGGLARPLAGQVTARRMAAGSVAAALIVALALRWAALPPAFAAVAAVALAAWFFRARLGGVTGDCLGAANQLVELAVFLALAARWPVPL